MSSTPGTEEPLISAVEQFLQSHRDITASRLGRDVMGDPSFVSELRAGRAARATTAAKVRTYLAARSAGQGA